MRSIETHFLSYKPHGATAKLLTMLRWVRVVVQIEMLHRTALTKLLCRSYSKSPETKKSVRIATFLRLAIVASSPIVNRGTKTQVICRVKAPFRFAGTGKSSQSQKGCRDAEIFVFTMADHRNGWISQGGVGSPQRGNHTDVRILGGSAGSNV